MILKFDYLLIQPALINVFPFQCMKTTIGDSKSLQISVSCFELSEAFESLIHTLYKQFSNYRPPEGGRLYDMKVVSGYAFLRTYFV